MKGESKMTKTVKKLYITTTVIFLVLFSIFVFPPFMSWWNKPELTASGWPLSEITLIVVSLLMSVTFIIAILVENRITAKEKDIRKRGDKLDY
jgi:hypothetical protein